MKLTYEEILGAVARGWCTPENERKEMDVDLAAAIAVEIRKALEEPSAANFANTDFTDKAAVERLMDTASEEARKAWLNAAGGESK